MGTRNLTAVQLGGKYVLAQYGQWDGYPSGVGVDILTFLRGMNKEKFIQGLGLAFVPTDEQLDSWWMEVGHDRKKGNGYVSMDIADNFNRNHPTLNRDLAGGILSYAQKAKEPFPAYARVAFAADSLFCEFAYVIDLDKETFEIFFGFNKEPLTEQDRFYSLKLPDDRNPEYYQVKLKKSYSLNDLPTKKQFLDDLKSDDEEA